LQALNSTKDKLPQHDRFTSVFKMNSEQLSRASQLISSCLHLQLVSNAPGSSIRGMWIHIRGCHAVV